MNEREWLTSSDPEAMLEWLRQWEGWPLSNPTAKPRASGRKLGLFAFACWRLWKPDHNDFDLWEETGPPLCRSAEQWARNWADSSWGDDAPSNATRSALLRDIFGNPFRPPPWRLHWLREGAEQWLTGRWEVQVNTPEEAERWTRILRWSDGTVMRLAQAIYEERAFDRMGILADALEEAGCTNIEILEHCHNQEPCPNGCGRLRHAKPCLLCGDTYRIPLRGPHVPGCWVLDCLLGKE